MTRGTTKSCRFWRLTGQKSATFCAARVCREDGNFRQGLVVLSYVAISHDTMRPGYHKTDNELSACSKAQKSRSNRSVYLKGEESSRVVLWVKGYYYSIKKALYKSKGAATT
jgi:hypothetical protein